MFSGDCWRRVAEQWRGFAVVFGASWRRWTHRDKMEEDSEAKKHNNKILVDLFVLL